MKSLWWILIALRIKFKFPSPAEKNCSHVISITYLEEHPSLRCPLLSFLSAQWLLPIPSLRFHLLNTAISSHFMTIFCVLPGTELGSLSELFFLASTLVILIKQEQLSRKSTGFSSKEPRTWFLALPITSFVISDKFPHWVVSRLMLILQSCKNLLVSCQKLPFGGTTTSFA